MTADDPSVTNWLLKLKAGDDGAAERLWNVFFARLVRLVQGRLPTAQQRSADAEDVALSAFASFVRGVDRQQFAKLDDRDDLWRILISIAIHKVLHLQRDQSTLKRGGQFRAIENHDGRSVIEELVSREPTPELAATVAEQYAHWMQALNSDELRQLTEWKLAGFTNDEIAAKTGRTTRTIERKLNLIRSILLVEISEPEDA